MRLDDVTYGIYSDYDDSDNIHISVVTCSFEIKIS